MQRRRRSAGVVLGAVAAAAAVVALTSQGGSPTGHVAQAQTVLASGGAPSAASGTAHPPTAPTHSSAGPGRSVHRTSTPPPRTPPHHSPGSAAENAAVDHVLHYTSYVQLAGHRRREIALTFDDGPSPYTPQVLRILNRFHIHATFFVVGREVSSYKRLVAAEVQAGNDVGDHTMTHPPLAQLSAGVQAAQLSGDARLIRAAGAPAPRLMRPPYGSFNTTTLQVLRAQRLLMVLWSVDTSDYARPGVDRIAYSALSGAESGAIILMHDGGGDRSETVAALPRIITRLRQRGFRLVTVSQLLKDNPPPHHQPAPHSLSGGV